MIDSSTTELMPATVREWTDILARIRFGKVRAGGKNITGAAIKLVAGRLASYADGNGTRVRPGVARIAVDMEMDARTVKTAMAYLRSIGLLELVRPGGRRGADQYRLTLPVDLLDRDDLTVWSPTEQRNEIERLSDARRGTPRTPPDGPGGGGSRGPQAPLIEAGTQGPAAPMTPVDNSATQGPVAPHKAADVTPISGASGTRNEAIMGASGTVYGGPLAPATHQDLDTTTTHHPDEDLRTAVTLPRDPSPATTPDSAPRPKRCTHGLPGGLRDDGQPACALCRVAENRPAVYRPPPAGDHLAPVIQLHTREAS
jgi:hypothetical protein